MGFKDVIEKGLKHNKTLLTAYQVLGSTAFRLYDLGRPQRQTILFTGLSGGFNDSPRVLYEAMIDDPRFSSFQFIWGLKGVFPDVIAGNPRTSIVKIDSKEYLDAALSARCWVSATNIERGLHFKRKNCVYLNTWHGIPLKTIGNAVPSRNDFDYVTVDCFCCSGLYDASIYVRDLKVRPESLLPVGLPRNDVLYDEVEIRLKREHFLSDFGIPQSKKVILYAPTWRDEVVMVDDFKKFVHFDLWLETLGNDYVVLFRSHPNTMRGETISKFYGFAFDCSDYPDINDLYAAADVLISDYSSVYFDFGLLGKPMFCYGYDYEDYRTTRGLYLDLDQVIPNGVIEDEQTLLKLVEKMDWDVQKDKTKSFVSQYCEYGANATAACLNYLAEALNETN